MWRVQKGLHHSITYSFLPVGHTKFSPDWCFGLLKQKLRRSKVDCMEDIVKVVEKSANVNCAQQVGTQSGEIIVPTYNWQGLLSPFFKRIPSITKFHQFKITKNDNGNVNLTVRKHSNTTETTVDILKSTCTSIPTNLPEIIEPKGLSLDRQWYLHDKIRQFCSDDCKDLVCPKPSNPPLRILPPLLQSSPSRSVMDSDTELEDEPQPKRQRCAMKCGNCGQTGHNKRTCPTNNI